MNLRVALLSFLLALFAPDLAFSLTLTLPQSGYHIGDNNGPQWNPQTPVGNSVTQSFFLKTAYTLQQITFNSVNDNQAGIQFFGSVDGQNCLLCIVEAATVTVDGIPAGTLSSNGNVTLNPGISLAAGAHTITIQAGAAYDLLFSMGYDDITWRNILLTVGAASSGTTTTGPFNAVDLSQPINGAISTKIVNAPFSLDILALNNQGTDLNTNYQGTVNVILLNSADNTGALDSKTACMSTWIPLQTLGSATFQRQDQGRKTVANLQYSDALQDARIMIVDQRTRKYACSTDNFAIRPDHLSVQASHNDWDQAGVTYPLNTISATPNDPSTPHTLIHKAGRPFTLTATAVDANGTPIPGYTKNYAANPSLAATVVLPSGGVNGALLTNGNWNTVGAGITQNHLVTYDEAGAIALQATDDTFASVDANDGITPTCQRVIGLSCALTPYGAANPIGGFNGPQPYYTAPASNAGRFVPDHFSISAATLQNRSDPATLTGCVNPFSYLDEQFDTIFTITAQNATGGTTQNYTGALVKFDQAFQPDRLATQGRWNLAALDNASGSDLSARLWQNGFLGATSFRNGVAAGVHAQLRIRRQGSAPNYMPDGPFLQSHLGINPVDGDGVGLLAAQQTLAIGANAYFDTGSTALYFGRLAADNAYGSELSPLPMWGRAQYWQNGAWLDKTDDTCTLFGVSVPAGVQLGQNSAGDGRGYWTALDYSGTGGQIYPANINGHRAGWRLWYTAGGTGGDFSISFAPHNYLISQAGLASFGHFQGNRRILYWRERFN